MKKHTRQLVIASFLSLFLPSALHAQIGVKFGVSLSALFSSRADDFRPFLGHEVEWMQYGESRPVIGVHLGVFYSIRLSKYFDLQPEISFTQRGYWFDQTPIYDARYVVRINYLELPVVIKYRVPIDAFNLNLSTGPFVAINLGAHRYIEYQGKADVKSLTCVKPFDYGIAMGLGSEVKTGMGHLVFDLQFNWGLNTMMTQPNNYIDLYEDPGRVRNLALTLVIGHRFDSAGRSQRP
jgi:hypothetical protein